MSTSDSKSINYFLNSEDPLSKEALEVILSHKEEDIFVDYKKDFDGSIDKSWLEITKDIMAFANTNGGYLVFGVKDGSFDPVGIPETAQRTLTDTNLVIQKVNRNLEPDISSIRCKLFERDSKMFVFLFIPPSQTKTHVFKNDASFTYSSGKVKTILRMGTFYVRRSAGNHLADSQDIEELFLRRLQHYKDNLMKNIARVVEAPQESHLFVLSSDSEYENEQRFIIDNAPDAIPIKGMSFTIAPETIENEIAAFVALAETNPKIVPPRSSLWEWYANRSTLKLSKHHQLQIALFSFFKYLPVFYWLKGSDAKEIKSMLLDTISRKLSGPQSGYLVRVSNFMGQGFHKTVINRIGSAIELIPPTSRRFPDGGPRSLMGTMSLRRYQNSKKAISEKQLKNSLAKELDTIATEFKRKKLKEPTAFDRARARTLDCYLYASDNRYVVKSNKK